jgi:hypothetical protein
MKIRANVAALYSILNPDTSSDSPSGKSNGARFVSARIEMSQRKIIGGIMIKVGVIVDVNIYIKLKD